MKKKKKKKKKKTLKVHILVIVNPEGAIGSVLFRELLRFLCSVGQTIV
jgi:hypothetical protein